MLSAAIARQLGVSGAAVLRVPAGSAAPRSGLRGIRIGPRDSIIPGDVIVAVDGKEVGNNSQLVARLDDYKPGDVVKLMVWREGKRIEVAAELQQGE